MHFSRHTLTTLVIAAALTGCGGGAGSSDKDEIAATIQSAFTENDPALCGELLTETFIKTFYGTVAKCRETARQGANADSVAVLQTSIKGELATALIQASGGSASPKPVTLRLVKVDGGWRIDGVTS